MSQPDSRHPRLPVVAPLLLTFGHGTATQDDIVRLLRGAGVTQLVDVRRYPGSRAHPHVARDAMAQWLPAAGIGYRSQPRLGGRRRLPPDSPDTWWEVAAFRAYAAHMRTPEFSQALDPLLQAAAETRTAVMCSETVWWRCHRRLIAELLHARGHEVVHLLGPGQRQEHKLLAEAEARAGRLYLCGALVA